MELPKRKTKLSNFYPVKSPSILESLPTLNNFKVLSKTKPLVSSCSRHSKFYSFARHSKCSKSLLNSELQNIQWNWPKTTLAYSREDIENSFLVQKSGFTSFESYAENQRKLEKERKYEINSETERPNHLIKHQLEYNLSQKNIFSKTFTEFQTRAYKDAYYEIEKNSKSKLKMPKMHISSKASNIEAEYQLQNAKSLYEKAKDQAQTQVNNELRRLPTPSMFSKTFVINCSLANKDIDFSPAPTEGPSLIALNKGLYLYGGLSDRI